MKKLRVLREQLSFSGERADFKGQAFSGVAYTLEADHVSAEAYRDGRLQGAYREPCFQDGHALPQIRHAALQAQGSEYSEVFLYQGRAFEGVSYEFDEGYCIAQRQFEAGEPLKSMEWLSNGEVLLYEHYGPEINEYVSFHPEGGYHKIKLSASGALRLELEFDAQSALSHFHLEGPLFEQRERWSEIFQIFPLSSEDSLQNWRAAPRLFLSGPGVDAAVLKQILAKNGARALEELSLFKTAIAPPELLTLAPLPQLRDLKLRESRETEGLCRAALLQLQQKRPGLKIRYNRAALA